MTPRDKTTLKGYFNAGDVPNEDNYGDLIDTIFDGGEGSGGHTIQDEGSSLTGRANLNFVGNGVTVTDDSGNDQTIVTIPGQPISKLLLNRSCV